MFIITSRTDIAVKLKKLQTEYQFEESPNNHKFHTFGNSTLSHKSYAFMSHLLCMSVTKISDIILVLIFILHMISFEWIISIRFGFCGLYTGHF